MFENASKPAIQLLMTVLTSYVKSMAYNHDSNGSQVILTRLLASSPLMFGKDSTSSKKVPLQQEQRW